MPLCNWSGGHNSCNSCVTWTATRLSFLIQVVMPQHTNDIGLASLSLLLVDAYIVNQTNGAPNKPLVGCLSLGSPCATPRLLMSGNALSYAGVHPSTLVHTLHVKAHTSLANVGQRLVVRRGTSVHARAHIARDHVSTVTYILLYNPFVVAN